MSNQYSTEQLIDALVNEWIYLCHDDPQPDDLTPEEYRNDLQEYTYDELIEETQTDDGFTLDEFMRSYG